MKVLFCYLFFKEKILCFSKFKTRESKSIFYLQLCSLLTGKKKEINKSGITTMNYRCEFHMDIGNKVEKAENLVHLRCVHVVTSVMSDSL